MINFSYCLDAAGNLIRLCFGQNQDALISGAVELTSTAAELAHPFPWTKTVEDAISEVRFVPRPHVLGTIAQPVSENRALPQSPYIYVPRTDDFAEDEQIMEMILLYDELPQDSDGRAMIVSALFDVGVQQIPFIMRFCPELHEGALKDGAVSYSSPGWISYSKVHRKAKLA